MPQQSSYSSNSDASKFENYAFQQLQCPNLIRLCRFTKPAFDAFRLPEIDQRPGESYKSLKENGLKNWCSENLEAAKGFSIRPWAFRCFLLSLLVMPYPATCYVKSDLSRSGSVNSGNPKWHVPTSRYFKSNICDVERGHRIPSCHCPLSVLITSGIKLLEKPPICVV